MMEHLSTAVVVGQDPDNYGVLVALTGKYGGQGPALSVQVGTHGPRDAVRGHFPELPLPGTHGVVAFPRKDLRNGIWLVSYSPNIVDASTLTPGQGGVAYAAHYGGGYSWRGADGTTQEGYPDGTTVTVGPSTPSLTRHTVNGKQQRVRSPYGMAQRVPAGGAAAPVTISHSSGASASISATGAVNVKAANGQTLVIQANGCTMTIDTSGNLTIVPLSVVNIGPAGSAQFVKLASGANSTTLKAN